MFSGDGKFYSPVVTFMDRGQNKTFKGKSQIIIYRFALLCWAEFIIPFKNLTFSYA